MSQLTDSKIFAAFLHAGITVIVNDKSGKAKCPFHEEQTPSCILWSTSETFYCFGCHMSGTPKLFAELIAIQKEKGVAETRDQTKTESLLGQPEADSSASLRQQLKEAHDEIQRLNDISKLTAAGGQAQTSFRVMFYLQDQIHEAGVCSTLFCCAKATVMRLRRIEKALCDLVMAVDGDWITKDKAARAAELALQTYWTEEKV